MCSFLMALQNGINGYICEDFYTGKYPFQKHAYTTQSCRTYTLGCVSSKLKAVFCEFLPPEKLQMVKKNKF